MFRLAVPLGLISFLSSPGLATLCDDHTPTCIALEAEGDDHSLELRQLRARSVEEHMEEQSSDRQLQEKRAAAERMLSEAEEQLANISMLESKQYEAEEGISCGRGITCIAGGSHCCHGHLTYNYAICC